jgi:hypothetical protein
MIFALCAAAGIILGLVLGVILLIIAVNYAVAKGLGW